MQSLSDQASSFKVRIKDLTPSSRAPMGRSLGPIIKGYCPCMADTTDPLTVLSGAMHRFCRKRNKPRNILINEFSDHVRKRVRQLFPNLSRCCDDSSLEKYLQTSHYTIPQKENLTRLIEEHEFDDNAKVLHELFGKKEFFTQWFFDPEKPSANGALWKHIRGINAPMDVWKALLGPYIHDIEDHVTRDSHFAKHIPVIDRPAWIEGKFRGLLGPFVVTDYSSFEALASNIVAKVEMILYEEALVDHPRILRLVRRYLTCQHTCTFKRKFVINITGVRMSGDSNTSLGNGFINWMIMDFVAFKSGCEYVGVVEGDDGLFHFSSQDVKYHIIQDLGFEIKMEKHNTIYDTSFCGMMLSHSLAVYSEPCYVMASFAWTVSALRNSRHDSVRYGLLRAKALSMLYCYPRCPIITAMAKRYELLTRGYEVVTSRNYWERRLVLERRAQEPKMKELLNQPITLEDRIDFESFYQISPSQQIVAEEAWGEQQISAVSDSRILSLFRSCVGYSKFYEQYVSTMTYFHMD